MKRNIKMYYEIEHEAPKNKSEREYLQGKIEILQGQNEIIEPRISQAPRKSLTFADLTKTVAGNKAAIERISQLLS